jgi:hypothetical protein
MLSHTKKKIQFQFIEINHEVNLASLHRNNNMFVVEKKNYQASSSQKQILVYLQKQNLLFGLAVSI